MITTNYILYETDPTKPISVYMGSFSSPRKYFDSVDEARNSNCHGMYKDRVKYKIAKIKREIIETAEVLSENIDPASNIEIELDRIDKQDDLIIKSKMDELGIVDPWERCGFEIAERLILRTDRTLLSILDKKLS